MPIKESLYNEELEYEICEPNSNNIIPKKSSANQIGYSGLGAGLANTVDAIASNSARAVEAIGSTVQNCYESHSRRMESENTNKKDVALAAFGDDAQTNAYIFDRYANGKEIEKTNRTRIRAQAKVQISADKKELQMQKSADRRDVKIRKSDNSLEKVRLKQEGKTKRTSYVTDTIKTIGSEIDYDALCGIKKK